jgi:hypothetical protein
MTVELEEFTEWRHRVEERLCKLEAASDRHAVQITDHGGHLVSMDEDLSKIQVEFRAQRGMLQALHDTQSEHTAALTELRAGQQELRLGHAKVLAGVQTILGLLKSAEGSNS